MNKAEISALVMPAADAVPWADWEKWAEKSLEEFAVEVVRLYEEKRKSSLEEWVWVPKEILADINGEVLADGSTLCFEEWLKKGERNAD